MSGGQRCQCPGRTEDKARSWVCTRYKQNRSAFNGGRITRSRYSEVYCRVCRNLWRTDANYVEQLVVMPLSEVFVDSSAARDTDPVA